MLNMLNRRFEPFKSRFVAALSLGICVVVLQLSCNGSQSNTPSTPSPSPSATGQTAKDEQTKTTEKKLTATGIDSLLIEREYEISANPVTGKFNRPTLASESESILGELKDIVVFDEKGTLKKELNCLGNDSQGVDKKCKMLIEGLGNRSVVIEDVLVGSDKKVLLTYEKTLPNEHSNSPRNKWGFLKTFNITAITLWVNNNQEFYYSPTPPSACKPCSVDVTYLYN